MFRKPVSVKSNVQLKNSDKKKLREKLSVAFPGLSEVSLSEIVSNKSECAAIKLLCHSTGDVVIVYSVDKQPLVFEIEKRRLVIPTVYFTWKCPEVVPHILIEAATRKFLDNGADLMAPGILRNQEGTPLIIHSTSPLSPKRTVVAVTMVNRGEANQMTGPLAVGVLEMDLDELSNGSAKGKAVEIVHIHRDHLWQLGSKAVLPELSLNLLGGVATMPSKPETVTSNKTKFDADFPPLIADVDSAGGCVDECSDKADGMQNENVVQSVSPLIDDGNDAEEGENSDVETGEQLLHRCFLAALKFRLKKMSKEQYPFDVSAFYTRCLLPTVPEGRRLDLKKTKYKKLSGFLSEASTTDDGDWLLKITSKSKGVDMISDVNWANSALSRFCVSDERITDEPSLQQQGAFVPPSVEEHYAITQATLPLFRRLKPGSNKGDTLTAKDVRQLVTEYVRERQLNHGNKVALRDADLNAALGVRRAMVSSTYDDSTTEVMDFRELFDKLLSRMTACVKIAYTDDRPDLLRRGASGGKEAAKIRIRVEKPKGRANKLVTLIDNLSLYGLEPKEVAKRTQVAVATSAIINDIPPSSNQQSGGQQVQIQGNQVAFLERLLVDEYHIPRKHIIGLELAPKHKK